MCPHALLFQLNLILILFAYHLILEALDLLVLALSLVFMLAESLLFVYCWCLMAELVLLESESLLFVYLGMLNSACIVCAYWSLSNRL